MKIRIISLIFISVILVGCTNGTRQGQLTVLPDGSVSYSGSAFGIMNPADPGPTQLANAKLVSVMADNMKNNGNAKSSIAGGYIGVVYNLESSQNAYLTDPEKSVTYTIPPGGFQFVQTNNIPEYIYVKYTGQRNFTKTRIFKKPGFYNGVRYDYGVRVYRN